MPGSYGRTQTVDARNIGALLRSVAPLWLSRRALAISFASHWTRSSHPARYQRALEIGPFADSLRQTEGLSGLPSTDQLCGLTLRQDAKAKPADLLREHTRMEAGWRTGQIHADHTEGCDTRIAGPRTADSTCVSQVRIHAERQRDRRCLRTRRRVRRP